MAAVALQSTSNLLGTSIACFILKQDKTMTQTPIQQVFCTELNDFIRGTPQKRPYRR